MASFANHFAFFLFLVLSSSVLIEARESKFFSKIFHLGARISPFEVPAPTPTPAPTLAPAPASAAGPVSVNSGSQLDPYYGLYGRGSGMFPSAKETVSTSNNPTATTAFEDDLLAEQLADEKYETSYDNNNYNNNGYTTSNYNNDGYTTGNYNNNGYTLSNYNNNGYTSSYKTNGYSSSSNNGYENERQGMSDTRFMEGGKYYYDVKNENYYPTRYESSGKETTKNEGYYGNTENSNKFNSIEEFQERQEEYVP